MKRSFSNMKRGFSNLKRSFSNIRQFLPFILFSVCCLTLLILHGLDYFIVDYVSIALLVLLAIPIIGKFIESITVSGYGFKFKELNIYDKFYLFLESMSEEEGWTFYPPRANESSLGQGFGLLIKHLLVKDSGKLIDKLFKWIKSENNNTKWFAAEIIGFFKIEELKEELPKYFHFADKSKKLIDKNKRWEPWRLNCLWAYSRFNNYEELGDFLIETTIDTHQEWIIQAIEQMIDTEKNKEIFNRMLKDFSERNDISTEIKLRASCL